MRRLVRYSLFIGLPVVGVVAIILLTHRSQSGPTFSAESPVVEEVDVENGVRTSVWKSDSGRHVEVRVHWIDTGERPDPPRVPASGRVEAFLDHDGDGLYTQGVDEPKARADLSSIVRSKDPTLLLQGLFELPVLWRVEEALSFQIEIRDESDERIATFAFRVQGLGD